MYKLQALVAELPFDAQAQRCTVCNGKVAAVHAVSEDRLRVESVSYEAAEQAGNGSGAVTVDVRYVDSHLGKLVQDEDLSRYIL